jgi:AraC-like DNA-binding protein
MADPLADLFKSVRLTGGVFLDARLTTPWCVISKITAEDCSPFMKDLAQVVAYHVVLEGSMLVSLEAEPAIELQAGEIVLLPRNDTHVMSSAPGLPPVSAASLIQQSPEGDLLQIRYGGGGETTSIICGLLGTRDAYNPLFSRLPRVLKLDVSTAASRNWIEASVRFAADELTRGRLATSPLMARLAEVLLVEAVREYIVTHEDRELGWLKGLSDPKIGRAIALMHADVAAPWTADTLAKEVALSRSTFMERFADLIGIPPIRYLTVWRLETAKRYFQESGMSVAQIANAVGYESEEGFRRAFRREFKMWPAEWRDRQRSA